MPEGGHSDTSQYHNWMVEFYKALNALTDFKKYAPVNSATTVTLV